LIGPSGAGKTTFVKLLLRLHTPTDGQILIDGTDISDVTQGSLRKNIAMVPQDTILFHRTLAENIGYGDPGATKEDIEKAAELAHCDDFIKELPYGFETYVGERGIKLSGGERQRVAIARAILKNAPILVLDEATSSLDSRSESLIQDALNTLMASRTTIVIAHRLSTIKQTDRIIVIDNGNILEQGSHEELLNKEDSLYKKLWTFQAGGFLTDEDDEEDEETEEEVEDDEEKNRGDAKLANF
jgi:ATP-binding cassette subfamily B protein